jgi:hypothetical protein
MTNGSETPRKVSWLKITFIATGLLLTFGWAMLVASNDSLINLSSTISPRASDQGTQLATIILQAPLIVGSILLPIGIVHGQKLRQLYKVLFVIATAIIVYYAAFYFLIIAGIALHGLGPR